MRRSIRLAALWVAGILSASAGTIQTWNFTGACSDCPGNGTGVLTVNQDQPNGPLSFQFTYSSAWITYTMNNAALTIDEIPFSGTTFTIPTSGALQLTQEVPITSFGGTGNPFSNPGVYTVGLVDFFSVLSGNTYWQTGPRSSNSDFGTGGTWTQAPNSPSVPEPSSVVLIGCGLGCLIFARRRNQ